MAGTSVSLMMNGMQTFVDEKGIPYDGGQLFMYVPPASTTPKDTWADIDQIALNPSPIILDSAGRCVIWGEGEYRQVLLDRDGNLIWDKITISFATADDVNAILADLLVSYYDLPYSGQLIAGGQDILRYKVTRQMKLPAGLTASQIGCKDNPGATWTWQLYQNLVNIGSFSINTSSVVSVTFPADVTLQPGDFFRVGPPTSADGGTIYLSATFVMQVL